MIALSATLLLALNMPLSAAPLSAAPLSAAPLSAAPLSAAPGEEPLRLRIDPLLIAEVVEVYRLIASDDNPVWPGWNAADTPILLYLPKVQDALINHPAPPAGFAAVNCPLLPEGWTLHLRDGTTEYVYDGQNTSRNIAGVETLVVADTISNLRPQLAQLMRDPRDAEAKVEELDLDMLATDPYGQLSFVVHEAFHVHQVRAAAPGKGANEFALLDYPWLAAENNADFNLEGQALARALEADDIDGAYEAALEFLGVRHERRQRLSSDSIGYEDGTEFNEGLAQYTEWRLSHVLEGREPATAMRWARDFRGYADLGFWRARLLRKLRANMNGEVAVNGDPYGSGMLRFRLYDSGMAIAALLDRLEVEAWQERIFAPGTSLTGLLQEHLFATDEDLTQAAARAREQVDYEALLEAKRVIERDGSDAATRAAERILAGAALFTLDYEALGDASVGWSMSPFGITRVDDARTIYGVIPVGASISGGLCELRQDALSPALHDARRHTIQFQLAEALDAPELAALIGSDGSTDQPLENIDVKLPGARVQAARGRFHVDAGGVTLELLGN